MVRHFVFNELFLSEHASITLAKVKLLLSELELQNRRVL